MPDHPENANKRRLRSSAVPLSIVPALAALFVATDCSRNVAYDPCDQSSYMQSDCDAAIVHHGYWYGGAWYPRVYSYAPFYYLNRYNSYAAGGGRMRSLSPTTYSPTSTSTSSRPSVVRGGFGSIGSGHAFAGS
ncbi:MAG: hypothetical protein ABI442_13720 [Gemmatimonadaceae bacterium]